jgi:hypothetical protein
MNFLHVFIVRRCPGDRGSSPRQFKLDFFTRTETRP